MPPTRDLHQLAQAFDEEGVEAIALLGSHARGDAGPYSDVDLLRLMSDDESRSPGSSSHLQDDLLIVVSNIGPRQIEEWFTQPELAVNVITGLRQAVALMDGNGAFAALQARARAFTWDQVMQARANAYAGREMVGWIEEVHKGLEGLRRNDVGRLLHARFGCTWGLSGVMQVQHGILITGDNTAYDEVAEAMGAQSNWTQLRARAYGLPDEEGQTPSLRQQVMAGLALYVETARQLDGWLLPEHAFPVARTAVLIEQELKWLDDEWPSVEPISQEGR